jgi:hypothetical protein
MSVFVVLCRKRPCETVRGFESYSRQGGLFLLSCVGSGHERQFVGSNPIRGKDICFCCPV